MVLIFSPRRCDERAIFLRLLVKRKLKQMLMPFGKESAYEALESSNVDEISDSFTKVDTAPKVRRIMRFWRPMGFSYFVASVISARDKRTYTDFTLHQNSPEFQFLEFVAWLFAIQSCRNDEKLSEICNRVSVPFDQAAHPNDIVLWIAGMIPQETGVF